jgi:hypothetical protein
MRITTTLTYDKARALALVGGMNGFPKGTVTVTLDASTEETPIHLSAELRGDGDGWALDGTHLKRVSSIVSGERVFHIPQAMDLYQALDAACNALRRAADGAVQALCVMEDERFLESVGLLRRD